MRHIGQLELRRVLFVDAQGMPTLEGTNARILCAGRFDSEEVGRLAVCQDTEDAGSPVTVVLGIVRETSVTNEPLVISSGAASIALHPDGHIRLQGEEVTVDSSGRLRLQAGRIDLN